MCWIEFRTGSTTAKSGNRRFDWWRRGVRGLNVGTKINPSLERKSFFKNSFVENIPVFLLHLLCLEPPSQSHGRKTVRHGGEEHTTNYKLTGCKLV